MAKSQVVNKIDTLIFPNNLYFEDVASTYKFVVNSKKIFF